MSAIKYEVMPVQVIYAGAGNVGTAIINIKKVKRYNPTILHYLNDST